MSEEVCVLCRLISHGMRRLADNLMQLTQRLVPVRTRSHGASQGQHDDRLGKSCSRRYVVERILRRRYCDWATKFTRMSSALLRCGRAATAVDVRPAIRLQRPLLAVLRVSRPVLWTFLVAVLFASICAWSRGDEVLDFDPRPQQPVRFRYGGASAWPSAICLGVRRLANGVAGESVRSCFLAPGVRPPAARWAPRMRAHVPRLLTAPFEPSIGFGQEHRTRSRRRSARRITGRLRQPVIFWRRIGNEDLLAAHGKRAGRRRPRPPLVGSHVCNILRTLPGRRFR